MEKAYLLARVEEFFPRVQRTFEFLSGLFLTMESMMALIQVASGSGVLPRRGTGGRLLGRTFVER